MHLGCLRCENRGHDLPSLRRSINPEAVLGTDRVVIFLLKTCLQNFFQPCPPEKIRVLVKGVSV